MTLDIDVCVTLLRLLQVGTAKNQTDIQAWVKDHSQPLLVLQYQMDIIVMLAIITFLFYRRYGMVCYTMSAMRTRGRTHAVSARHWRKGARISLGPKKVISDSECTCEPPVQINVSM